MIDSTPERCRITKIPHPGPGYSPLARRQFDPQILTNPNGLPFCNIDARASIKPRIFPNV